jgi:hypothetical protein
MAETTLTEEGLGQIEFLLITPFPYVSVLWMVNCATKHKAKLPQNVCRGTFLLQSMGDDFYRRLILVSDRNETLCHPRRNTTLLEIRKGEIGNLDYLSYRG